MLLDLKISKVVFGGDGLSRFQGKVCFVEGGLPGESVLADLLQEKKNFSRAKTLKVLDPSDHRVEPPCPYYGFCGGCQYQHCDYQAELLFKQEQIREFIEKSLQSAAPILPICSAAKPYGYRNTVTLQVQFLSKQKAPVIGFMAKDNVTVIPVRKCLIADEQLGKVFMRAIAVRSKGAPERISFKLTQDGQIVSSQEDLFMRVRLLGESVIASARGFIQNNLGVTELLIGRVSDVVGKTDPDVFYDLFAGVGVFSITCARKIPKVFAVEENVAAASSARMNAEERELPAVKIIEDRVEKAFPGLWRKEKAKRPLIVADPPRQGMERSLCEFIRDHVDRGSMVYISCDPATLVRDLRIILSGGRLKIDYVIPFDMFPRTKHIETAVVLSA